MIPLILRSVAYELTCFMKVLILVELGLSLSTIAFLMVPCFRAENFESKAMILRPVAYELPCFMQVFLLVKLALCVSTLYPTW